MIVVRRARDGDGTLRVPLQEGRRPCSGIRENSDVVAARSCTSLGELGVGTVSWRVPLQEGRQPCSGIRERIPTSRARQTWSGVCPNVAGSGNLKASQSPSSCSYRDPLLMSKQSRRHDANQHEPAVEEVVEPIDPIEPIGSLGAYALLELLSEDELTRVYLGGARRGDGAVCHDSTGAAGVGRGRAGLRAVAAGVGGVARLEDPAILPIQEVAASGNYCVLPHVEGETLAEYVGARGRLLASDAAEVALGICRGMLHAHHQGLRRPSVSPKTVAIVAQPTKLRPTPSPAHFVVGHRVHHLLASGRNAAGVGHAIAAWLVLAAAVAAQTAAQSDSGGGAQMSQLGAFLLFATGGGRYRWTPWSTWSYRRSLDQGQSTLASAASAQGNRKGVGQVLQPRRGEPV